VTRPRIEFGVSDADGETAYFVADNGCGLDMAYAHKLFGAFSRLHGPDQFEGTGIGLATVKRILDRHFGRVWVKAAPGAGAVFYFTVGEQWRSKA
jgi:light-regulated signal transduction histidine kinase (bacteriophytochrome)